MPEDRLEEFARLGADLLGKFKGILYIGDPLKGSFRGVPVRDPLLRDPLKDPLGVPLKEFMEYGLEL